MTTNYRKYEFPNEQTYLQLVESLTTDELNKVVLGEYDGKYYVDILWTSDQYKGWEEYQIYPGVDTSHTFLGRDDYQYNTEINLELALCDVYPNFINKDVTLIQVDNLSKLIRTTPLSNKGIKGIKYYKYNDNIVWSIESIYWFEVEKEQHNVDGIVKIHTWYNKSGEPQLVTKRFVPRSNEDKELDLKEFRNNAINYLKSAQPQLFSLLYGYFNTDIINYINLGNKETLEDALNSSEDPTVIATLNYELTLPSGGTITVLQGILAELL